MAEGLGNVVELRTRQQTLRVVDPAGLPVRERADEDLMLDHAQGQEDAFEELVRRHQKGVLNYTFRMVQNRQIAEELTQEVFIALVRNAQRYQPTAKFTTYLYTIASNIVSKEWLRRKRRPLLFSLSGGWGKKDSEDDFDPMEHVGDERANIMVAFQRGEVSEAVNTALPRVARTPARGLCSAPLSRFVVRRNCRCNQYANRDGQVPRRTRRTRVASVA